MVDLPADIIELEAEPDYLSVMAFGESGAGKTPFGASSKNGLILRTEKGTASAKAMGSNAKIWPCDSWIKFKKAKSWLTKAAATPEGIPFNWVTIDSGTMLQTLHLRHILKVEKAKPGGEARSLDIPQIQDHQQWQNEFKRIMQEMIDLPMNLCVTALPMPVDTEDDEGEVETNILPQFLGGKGAIAWAVVGMFDMGGRVRLVKTKPKEEGEKPKTVQRIYWTKAGAYWGRDRYGALGSYTTNLTLDELAAKVAESMKD